MLGEMKRYLESLNKSICVTFGGGSVTGVPRIINGNRFLTEFECPPTQLKERLRIAALQPR